MAEEQAAGLSPERVLEELKNNGVTHVVWLPDSVTNFLYLLLDSDPNIDLITVSREGQAFSTAAGLTVGGKRPVVLIQNTGTPGVWGLAARMGHRAERSAGVDGGVRDGTAEGSEARLR